MILIERDSQLGDLKDLLSRARRGRAQVALLTGAVGCGKSTLLMAFGEHVAATGSLFLSASATHVGERLPFGVIAQLLHGLPVSAGLSAGLASRSPGSVRPPAVMGQPPATGDQARALIQQQACNALLRLAEPGGLVVAVDDVRYADPESLLCLLQLARQLRSARIMLVLADSPSPRPSYRHFHTELLRHPFYSSLVLPPLSAGGVHQVMEAHLGHVPEGMAEECLAATGGNPLLVRAIIEDQLQAATDAGSASGLLIGENFGRAVLSCLDQFDDVVRRVARGLAVLTESASSELIGRLLDITPELAFKAGRQLAGAGLTNGGRLRHERIRQAIVSDIPPSERRQVHRRAAEVLYQDGAAPSEIASHLIDADCGDIPWAAGTLRDAADRALASGQPRTAAACLRLAVRSDASRHSRAVTMAMLVRAEWQVSPLAVPGHLSEFAQAVRADAAPARETLDIIPFLLWHGRFDDAADCLSRASAVPAASMPQRRAAELFMSWFNPDHNAGPRPSLEDWLPKTGVSPSLDPLWQAHLVMVMALTDASWASSREAEQILQRCEVEQAGFGPVAAALVALIGAGQPVRAVNWANLYLRRPQLRDLPAWRAVLQALRAEALLRAGHLKLALQQAHEALAAMPPQAWGVAVGVPLATIILAATEAGDYDEGSRSCAIPVPQAMLHTPIGLLYLRARGRHHLATGRYQAALSDFQSCAELMRRCRLDQPVLVPWRLEMARVHLAQGEAETASGLITDQFRADRLDPATHGLALRLQSGTAVPHEQRVSLLNEAVDVLQRSDDRVELAHALADLGRVLDASGNARQAAVVTTRARALSHAMGARLLKSAPDSGRRPAVPDPGLPGSESLLSDAEHRVAVLAASGHTNRVIADRLFITVSTVEQHLTRIYRKLDITGRAELRVRFANRHKPTEASPGAELRGSLGRDSQAEGTEQVTLRHGPAHRPARAAGSRG
jgi:DNA-binding CsgD family transcriptional regulator